MHKTLLILSLLALTTLSIPVNLEELHTLWSSWKIYHGRAYSQAEEAARFAIFVENYKRVIDFNSKNTNVKQALNKFADITGEEFKTLHSGCYTPDSSVSSLTRPTPSIITDELIMDPIEVPSSVDWRTKGAIAPVQNQGQCGACWAFSAVGALEALNFIDSGNFVLLSQQQVIDCTPGSQGCNGGTMSRAFAYTASKGIEPAADYPYTAESGTCQYDASKAIRVNSGFQWVPFRDSLALKTAIAKQPVSVAIEADQEVFQLYSSGVITANCGTNVDHAVLAVGYATVGGQEGFIIQNSWSADWGMDGYVYISTDGTANDGNGVCGILTGPVVPTK